MNNSSFAENPAIKRLKSVDVNSIYNGTAANIDLDFEIFLDGEDTFDLVFDENPKANVRIYEKARGKVGAESYVAVEIKVSGTYTATCGRCAKSLTKDLLESAEYGLVKKLQDDSDEFIEATGGILDVYELARTLFFLELPTRVLCKDDCKGLCPVCGVDLNASTCSCKAVRRGKGLEELKKLLDK